jgi:hypothetical protein
VRIYLPATSAGLRSLLDDGELGPAPLTAFAVTAGLREWYVDDDLEALEYAASSEAARASLRLVDADATAARRRVVVALDAPDDQVEVRDDLDRGVVRLAAAVTASHVASVHVDDADAEPAVADAAAAITAADLGDEAAQEKVDDADGFELSWYAPQELEQLLASF